MVHSINCTFVSAIDTVIRLLQKTIQLDFSQLTKYHYITLSLLQIMYRKRDHCIYQLLYLKCCYCLLQLRICDCHHQSHMQQVKIFFYGRPFPVPFTLRGYTDKHVCYICVDWSLGPEEVVPAKHVDKNNHLLQHYHCNLLYLFLLFSTLKLLNISIFRYLHIVCCGLLRVIFKVKQQQRKIPCLNLPVCRHQTELSCLTVKTRCQAFDDVCMTKRIVRSIQHHFRFGVSGLWNAKHPRRICYTVVYSTTDSAFKVVVNPQGKLNLFRLQITQAAACESVLTAVFSMKIVFFSQMTSCAIVQYDLSLTACKVPFVYSLHVGKLL